jgi:thioredoxin reductase/CRP-like cAMP-binding protein
MLTIDDVRAVPLFSTLALPELERLARTSADLHLAAGEYAAYEGGEERALFAVLAGRFEVVKLFDGVERTLGWRLPGTVFGELPIALGTPLYGGYRASEPSRVMRVEIQEYYAIAAASPEISLKVAALARERIGGMQGIESQAHKPRVTMVGHRWDAACGDLRQFLERNQISYDWVTPDAPDLAARWPRERPAETECPVLILADGTLLVRPGTRELARRLGLATSARRAEYDTVIVGGGPAGLAAAVYGASEGLHTLVVEREAPGGQAGTSSRIENYLGFPSGVSGDELARRALKQAGRLGAEILVTRSVGRIDTDARQIHLDGGDVVRGDSLENSMSHYLIEQLGTKSNVKVRLRAEVVAAHGETHLTGIDIRDGASGTVRREDCGGLFVFIGADAETDWLPEAIARDARGYLLTGDDVVKAGRWSHSRDPYLLETSVPGVFACGDVRLSPVKRVASAVGEGSMAIAFVHRYLQQDAR